MNCGLCNGPMRPEKKKLKLTIANVDGEPVMCHKECVEEASYEVLLE